MRAGRVGVSGSPVMSTTGVDSPRGPTRYATVLMLVMRTNVPLWYIRSEELFAALPATKGERAR